MLLPNSMKDNEIILLKVKNSYKQYLHAAPLLDKGDFSL
jgi:hypothetical protein